MQRLPLAQYLFKRLRSQGVHAIHGVPGDFTLKALDHLSPSGVQWIGTCNELNAGYAADGYARVRGLGALFTTYGVGELSAINAVAGSFAESVPVVHIVGTPQRRFQDSRANVHHSLGDGRPRVFAQMHQHVTVAQTNLRDEKTAPEDIDRTIAAALRESKPVYIEVPCDMVSKEVDGARLEKTLMGGDFATFKEVDVGKEDALIADIATRLYNAKRPLILVDRGDGVRSPSLRHEINEFVRVSGLPTLCMPSGSGMVDHGLTNYYGVHSGPVGQIDTMPYVSEADLVLAFGPMFSDTQTLGWRVVPDPEKIITFGKNFVTLPQSALLSSAGSSSSIYPGATTTTSVINLLSLLPRLKKHLDTRRLPTPDVSSLGDFRNVVPRQYPTLTPSTSTVTTTAPPASASSSTSTSPKGDDGKAEDGPIDQTNFYHRLNPYLRPNDTVLLANATPKLCGRDLVLPAGAQIIASGQWFSIGHMLPAALGASLAQHSESIDSGTTSDSIYDSVSGGGGGGAGGDNSTKGGKGTTAAAADATTTTTSVQEGRTILLEGDGSFQVTAQELSTVIRHRVPLTVFLVNNSGYAYERQIHGLHETYNDLAPWKYDELPFVFSGRLPQRQSQEQGQGQEQPCTTTTTSTTGGGGGSSKYGDDDDASASSSYPIRSYVIRTWRDLDALLASEEFCAGQGLHFVDVKMDKYDVPEKFRVVFQRAGEQLG
ncbi:hypothetical protein PV08_08901 [Exophiala spinifera]|uniref:Pyruvate decarboxylase n=1 Tax=Exophiala spinifera TaxID=91928 RepID=A0A0D2B4S5_9EURO|nr:uncharacterized protein PV08_08901 [Exophiala spinifera]KIW13710.1 hypothetical protein PV08_08901 [Exophiala spinifera]